MKINIRTSRILVFGALIMAVAWFASAALVQPALVTSSATYVPISTPGGGHKSFIYMVKGLKSGTKYTLVTDGSAQQIDNFYALNPANVVHLPKTSGTHFIVSYGDTVCFYGLTSNSVHSSLTGN